MPAPPPPPRRSLALELRLTRRDWLVVRLAIRDFFSWQHEARTEIEAAGVSEHAHWCLDHAIGLAAAALESLKSAIAAALARREQREEPGAQGRILVTHSALACLPELMAEYQRGFIAAGQPGSAHFAGLLADRIAAALAGQILDLAKQPRPPL